MKVPREVNIPFMCLLAENVHIMKIAIIFEFECEMFDVKGFTVTLRTSEVTVKEDHTPEGV